MKYEEVYRNLSHNIRHLRKVHGLTQQEMAQIMGISAATLGRIERQEPGVRLYAAPLCRLCDHFHYRVDEIMYENWPDMLKR